MRPTEILPLQSHIYSQITGFLKFKWFFVSILFGLITSWSIKDSITPLLLWGKSFAGRSILSQVGILILYVFFISTIFFFTLIIASLLFRLLWIKWGKTPSYYRVQRKYMEFVSYFYQVEKMEIKPIADEPIYSSNLSAYQGDKIGNFNLVGWLKSYWVYVAIYLFFLYVSSTTARSGDDWEVSYWYQTGFLSTLAEMIHFSKIFNARVVGNFYSAFFTHYDILWRFTAPAVFTSVIFLSARLFGYIHRPVPVGISFLMLLSVSDEIRLETYIWMIGNGSITIIALILLYLNIIFDENTERRLRFWQHGKLNSLMVFLLAFTTGLFVETATAGLTAASILLALMSLQKTRKISPFIRYGLVGCALSCLVILSTPNTLAIQGFKVSLTQRIVQNLPGIMQMLVIDNLPIYFLFFVIFIAFILTGEMDSGAKKYRVVGVISASFIAIIILTRLMLQFTLPMWYLPFGNFRSLFNSTFFDVNNLFPLVFCLTILFYVLMAVFLSRQKEKLLVLYSVGMVSAGVMLGAPYLGARIFSLAIFMLVSITAYMASTIKIKSIDLRKAAILALILFTFLQVEKFYFNGEYVRRVETIRSQLIDSYRARLASDLTTGEDYLVLPVFREDMVGPNANIPFSGYYMQVFKRYHHLPTDANIIFDNGFALKDFTVTQIDGLNYQFEVSPLYDVSKYTYKFVVRKNGSIIYKSVVKTDNFDYYGFPGKGTYTISCVLTNATGEREVHSSYYQYSPLEIK